MFDNWGLEGPTLTIRGPWRTEYVELFASEGYTSLELNGALGFSETNLDFLADVPNVRQLLVLSSIVTNDAAIESCTTLQELQLTTGARHELRLSSLADLEEVYISRPGRWSDLLGSGSLRSLYVDKYREADLRLFHTPNLKNLKLAPARNLLRLDGAPQLASLEIGHAVKLASLASIVSMKNLQVLHLNACRSIADISPLGELAMIEDLFLNDCGQIETLQPVRHLPLRRLMFYGDTKVLDGRVREIVELPSLVDIAFHAWRHYDITQQEAARIVASH